MAWSADAVLDYHPRTHGGVRWRQKRLLLWPAWAWRVVVPVTRDRKLNPLQRVVLRLHVAGRSRPDEVAPLLGLHEQLVALVSSELLAMGLIDRRGRPTERGARLLDEAEPQVDDLQVGWVFQGSFDGRLMPRFVEGLSADTVDEDGDGWPLVTTGTKGRPLPQRATVLKHGPAAPLQPGARDILEAARRHRLHGRRARRAQQDMGLEAPAVLERVSLVSPRPQRVHLLSFVYVAEDEHEEEPWYVAEPFGFGASPELRGKLQRLRSQATGTFRALLDGLVGEQLQRHRDRWLQMRKLIEEEARLRVDRDLPRGAMTGDEAVRERLFSAQVQLVSLEQRERAGARSPEVLNGAYLSLRQALEQALVLLMRRHPPGEAWRKLDGLPGRAMGRTIRGCGLELGFPENGVPRAISKAKLGTVRWICSHSQSANLRPALATLLLAAVDDAHHPLRVVATGSPRWLHEVNEIAQAAGGQVHNAGNANLKRLQGDAQRCIAALRSILDAMGNTSMRKEGRNHGRK